MLIRLSSACMVSPSKVESIYCLCQSLALRKRLTEGCSRSLAAWLPRARRGALIVAPRFPQTRTVAWAIEPAFFASPGKENRFHDKEKVSELHWH